MANQEKKGQQADELEESWVRDLDAALQEAMLVDLDNLPAMDNTEANEVFEVEDDGVEVVLAKDDSASSAKRGANSAKTDEGPALPTENDRSPVKRPRPRWAAGALRQPTGETLRSSGDWAIWDCLPTWMV